MVDALCQTWKFLGFDIFFPIIKNISPNHFFSTRLNEDIKKSKLQALEAQKKLTKQEVVSCVISLEVYMK